MPNVPLKDAISNAKKAVAHAQQVRRFHARRTPRTSKQRARDIAVAQERIADAMRPLRSEIGRFPYGPQTDIAERNREAVRRASEALQRERRKLWKLTHGERKAG